MAKITQVVETRFKSSGGQQVAKETEQIGKAQTRLGQASASAGRSFSAQAQGLGGVVGVYAAAAANVFALTAAFTALNRAAQFETILRGTESLANAVGTDANSVVKSLKNITAGQLSIVEAATQANLALSAGFNLDQIEQLGKVALKASRALGRNLTDAFQRITRGAIKLEPELLDEIGIFTRIEPAVAAYAASLNKAASSLTQFERRQAFVTQVIKDGQAAFQDITDSGESAQEVFESLVANFADLAIQVGGVLANALVPFAKFLDQGLGNRLALLGAVGLLVFGRLKTAIGAFAVEGLGNLSTRLSNVADSFANTTKNAADFTKQAAAASSAFVGGGAFKGAGRATGAELKRQLGAGFTTQQALTAQVDINRLLENEERERAAIKENIKGGAISQAEYNKQVKQSRIRTDGLKKTQALVNAQINASSKFGLRFAGALNVAAVAARGLGAALASAFALFQTVAIAITSLQILGSLFDFDLIGELTEAYKKFTAESRRTKAGLQDIINAARKGTPVFDELTSSISGTNEELATAVTLGAEKASLSVTRLTNDFNLLTRQIEGLQSGGFRGFFAREFTLSFKSVEERIKALRAELRATNVALNTQVENYLKLGLVVGTLAENSDVAGSSLGSAAAEGLLDLQKTADDTENIILKLSGGNIVLGEFVDGNLKMNEKMQKGGAVAADFADKLLDLENKLQNGTISADKAGSSFGVLSNQAKKAIDLLTEAGLPEEAAKIAESMNNARESTGKLVTEIVALNTFSKKLAKEFGAAFKAVDEALLKGGFSLMGEFAVSTEQAALNQSNLLKNIVEQARVIEDISDGSFDYLSIVGKTNELRILETQIIKATEGRQLKLLVTLDKQRKAEEKKLQALKGQRDVLIEQNKLSEISLDIAEQQADLSIQKNEQEANLKILENQNKLIDQQVINQEKQLDSAETLLQLEQARAKALTDQLNAKRDLENLRDRNALELAQRRADQSLDVADTRGISTPKQLSDLRIKAAEAANALELQAIEQRRQVAIDDYINQTQAIDDRVALLVREFEIENQKRQNAESAIRREQEVADQKASSALANNKAEFEIITSRFDQIRQQRELANLQAKIAKDQRISDLTILQANAELVKNRIASDKEILRGNEIILNGYTQVANALTGGSLPEIKIDATGLNTQNIDKTIKAISDQIKTTRDIFAQQTTKAKIAQDTAIAGLNVTLDKNMKEKTAIEEQLAATTKLNESKLTGLQNERTIAQTILDEKISLAELEKQSVADVLVAQMQKAGIEKETAIAGLEYAKEKARYELSYQARMDAANVATQAIVGDYVENGLMRLNDALIDGSITMGMVANTFKDMVGNMLREIQQAVFKKTIAEPISNFISGKVGSFFPTTSAAGGLMHLAGGGMLRDRVPAMLEPGEFVMRKDAVKQFGVDAMMRMNAAPRGYQSGGIVGSDASKNTPYDPARAAQLMDMGIPAAAAVALAQQESAKSTSDSTFSFSNSEARRRGIGSNMGFEPKYSAPVSGKQALDAVNKMLGIDPTKTRGTLTPSDLQSMQMTTPGATQTAGIFDFLDRGLSNKPSDVKKRQERFNKGGKKSKSKEKGIIDTLKEFVGLASAGVMNDASSAFTQFVGGPRNAARIASGNFSQRLGRAEDINVRNALMAGANRGPAGKAIQLDGRLQAFGGQRTGRQGSTNQFELQNAITNKGIQDATFDPTGNLAGVLGADGRRGIPISLLGAFLGLDVPNLFSKAPSPASLSARKARSVVNQRTGTQATGYKGSFKPGDVTSSGNFMRADETGVVSGIDPFALDKLGYTGEIAATMGGSKGFRAAGSGVEFASVNDFITANFEAPGRQSALTIAEYNSLSQEGKTDYAPGLGGQRALTATQSKQLALSGAYMNVSGFGLTIPSGGKFSGSVNKALSSTSGGDGEAGGDVSVAGVDSFVDAYADSDFLASGGLVRLKKYASGGAVQSRDRVPALLEPGEFVIRKPMAKAIGGPALNQMNATGKNLTPPNIEVNLSNEGAPKNVSAQAPRVQGDKIIIDMITRDLRNNGPIKKSLRK